MRYLTAATLVLSVAIVPLLTRAEGVALSAEPASILYMVTGAIALVVARVGTRRSRPTGVAMLFCSKSSREALQRSRLT